MRRCFLSLPRRIALTLPLGVAPLAVPLPVAVVAVVMAIAPVAVAPVAAWAQPASSTARGGIDVLPGRLVEQGDSAEPNVADPVVASVEGHPILLSDLAAAINLLPDTMRALPFDTLYPALLDRLVDHAALVMLARRNGYDSRPDVQRQVQAATDTIVEGAWLADVAAPKVTEPMIRTRYNTLYAGQPPTEEVHARHILLATQAEARKVIEDLNSGADFATIARVVSTDPDAAKGGDLGFFRRDQVWAGFADAAFALAPGQVAPDPVKNEFGWHVVKLEERRLMAPPSYAETRDQIRQDLLAAAVRQAIDQARAQVIIHRFNLDGTEIDPDAAVTGGRAQAAITPVRSTVMGTPSPGNASAPDGSDTNGSGAGDHGGTASGGASPGGTASAGASKRGVTRPR